MDKATNRISLPTWIVTLGTILMLFGIVGTVGSIAFGKYLGVASASPALYDEQAVVALYERANPAVVEIEVTQFSQSQFRFSIPQSGQGSGFLIDAEGHILTNYHVIQGATQIRVNLADGRTLDAQIVGSSPADDIALLKVDSQAVAGIQPLPLGDSSAAKPGQMAIALGSPFGLEGTITVGVVSGVNRSRTGIASRPITGMIQTDASMNPGNSGGPLLNSLGQVIGINTSIETSVNGATGVGFAVPINTAKALVAQFLEEGAVVKRPWLGITGMALIPAAADALGLTITRGVYVLSVVAGSPAAEAGLIGAGTGSNGSPGSSGDVITAVDGRSAASVEDLVVYFNTRQPGDSVVLTIVRSGRTIQVTVILGEWPDSFESSPG